jgi:hypothetical protein
MFSYKRNHFILKLVILSLVLLSLASTATAQRIYVENAQLKVNGQRIVLNGGNTPWNNWNDFGGSYNGSWWSDEFGRIKAAGGNCTRIWITCSGEVGINIDTNGFVSGATQAHWDNLADMFQRAQANKIYVLATLISFDHTKNTYSTYQRWRNMYGSTSNVASYVTNYVIPFVNKFKDNPYLFAIEPCNEIEWVNQDSTNAQLPWTTLQYFVASVVRAVHENSPVLTTVGCSMKWQTDTYPGNESNQFSDTRLKAQVNDPEVYLDVYSPHFYQWVIDWYGNPFSTNKVVDYGLTDKPCIIGEMPANGVGGQTITACIENAYRNGFQGVLPWTTNGVDGNGSLGSGLGAALTTFKNNYPELISPPAGTPEPTAVTTPVPTPVVSPTAIMKGDVNSDGAVNIVDALQIAQHYVGNTPANFNQAAADVDCNGSITIVDALQVARYYVGLISGFAC